MSAVDGALILDILAGIACLLIGAGVLIVCSAFARLLRRVNGTLDEVDRQIAALSGPLVETLGHVGGIADTADTTVGRLGAAVGALEGVAAAAGKTARLASDAVAPALVNVGATLTGVTAGLRRLVTGRGGKNEEGPGG